MAQDWRTPSTGGGRLRPAVTAHSGSSPFDPRKEDDTLFVVDTGSDLDSGCTFRSGGPFMIHLKVKRYVGPIGGDGTLSDPGGMISRGLISPKAHIRLPAFDVDVNGAPGFPPEVDRVFFNGHDLGTLTGDNNIWKLNEFDVPIAWVKFPPLGSAGSPPAPADNVIQIKIDEASVPDENWCTSIDWMEIEFAAVAPIFLVHGTNAQSDTWNPNFTAFFGNSRAPWSNDINLQANGSILGNGQLLAARAGPGRLLRGQEVPHHRPQQGRSRQPRLPQQPIRPRPHPPAVPAGGVRSTRIDDEEAERVEAKSGCSQRRIDCKESA